MRLLVLVLTLIAIAVSPGLTQNTPRSQAGINAEILHNKGTREFYVRSILGNLEESGLQPGDTIIKVGGIETAGLTAEKMEELINGEAGTELVLWVKSWSKKEIAVVILTRGEFGKDMKAFIGQGSVAPKTRILESSPELDRSTISKMTTGENRAGLGAAIDLNDAAELEIIQVIKGSAAEEAGMQAGDVILSVNGVDITRKPLAYSAGVLRGAEGSNVTLRIRAKGKSDIEEVIVTRKLITPLKSKL